MNKRHVDKYLLHHLDYITERKHDQTLPLSTLADSRLGIDASHYLGNLLESPLTREPFLAATGGLPLSLASRIESDLRALEKLHIKPVFVFPGLPPSKRITKNTPQQHAAKQMEAIQARRDAWSHYEGGLTDQATKLFESRSNIEQWDLWRSVLRIFRHRNVEFIIAPYSSLAQVSLVYYVHVRREPPLRLPLYINEFSLCIFNDILSLTSMPSTAPRSSCCTLASTKLSFPWIFLPSRTLPLSRSLTCLPILR